MYIFSASYNHYITIYARHRRTNYEYVHVTAWEDIFDVACGLWTFGKNCPSTQIVDSNPDSNNLSIQFYQRSRIDIKEPETFPLFVPSANGTCTCQAGWTSDENPDGLLEEVGKTTLFLSLGKRLSILRSPFPKRSTLSFFVHVCERVKSIHSFNTPPAPTQKLEGTYNPAKYGRAYYFTENGEQIRKMRSFSMDKREIKDTANDDTPDVRCRKVYPDVSKKGTTYLFLWFCPYHGHCLGFHIITGSEGRKDALASLYTHLEKGPETIFYDFACGCEYAKNRESGYFQDTRFFHDVFHGFSHKCSQAYNSSRLSGMNSPNTSICEQFNSFLQRIKASAKLMGQAHFTFYVQFFIHQWNIKVFNSSRTRMKIGYYGAFE
ncbi:uncharacterized protein LOC130642379 [Hydractinia symbiolongicarpus]|uniref:uncharacterized protein LOC130642379 n=1 Tax=Hydractinia symbiolongicarpus TaxID=13093 RepID=UPI002549FD5D|nr:uncharacterized protein LOC130642379 [Hydractinia symbiolongicarpus]